MRGMLVMRDGRKSATESCDAEHRLFCLFIQFIIVFFRDNNDSFVYEHILQIPNTSNPSSRAKGNDDGAAVNNHETLELPLWQ